MEKKLLLHKQNRVSGQTLTTAAAAAAGLARLIHHSQEHQELKSFGAVAANQSGQTVDLIRRVTAPATRATIIIYPTSKCPFGLKNPNILSRKIENKRENQPFDIGLPILRGFHM